ncbi:hypothetical protein LAZ67_4002342 [Cordylochernes scorpioides]|uniref:Maturase K n=1 Tax=Cordylochernes scorpioides TaxID=51811 RepID=A0ABY6KCX2_9ARAC|nr:hypothetical protein LAZ67_4002342 [Cordylochernes scorpioides]
MHAVAVSSDKGPIQLLLASVEFKFWQLYEPIFSNLIRARPSNLNFTAGTDNQTIDIILQLTKLCLSMGTFIFQKQYYSQIRGTPMGSPLSSIISEIVLGFLDMD